MSFTEREANMHDLYLITRNLSDISRSELAAHPHSTTWDVLKSVAPMLDEGRTVVWLENDVPIMVFGHTKHPLAAPDRVTWFVATQRYFDLGARGVRFARGYLQRMQRDWPRTVFWTYSGSKHPAMKRWFKLLGYGPMVDQTKAYRSFTLVPLAVPTVANAREDSPKRA